MIYVCGDTHGEIDLDKVINYFEDLKMYDTVSKDDYLIILGDVSVCWDGGTGDQEVQRLLNELPVTVLWLDGNHEGFPEIDNYPVSDWKGGKVQHINGTIHLMRGQVYTIDGKKIFTFGGGCSVDQHLRTPYVSWWPEEMPSRDEYDEGILNLERNDYTVDYILTHTCPLTIANILASGNPDSRELELNRYFDFVAESVEFEHWYFGHWHVDENFSQYTCLYNEIVELD